MIGNTHFDPVWLWKWDEAMSSITATFRSALDRMNEYPEFKYSFVTPPVFEWIKKTSPQMFEEIKERVKEGRWELAEGWWVQPDCYTPSGESLVRQGVYGQMYLMENFGQYSETVFNIDSFGHPATLPQILDKCRIKNYVMCRPEERHVELKEPLFNWRSKDGTTIIAYRDDQPYRADTAESIKQAESLPYDSMLVYGVTDHGGAPTIKSINEIQKCENASMATVKEFFEGRKTDYTVEQEFITGDFGVYVNNTHIKSLNRKVEYAVLNAEKTSVIANNYDSEMIKKCWHDVLFNQFHDIVGGGCIKDVYFHAENVYGRAISTADEITHFNLLSVTNKIKLPGKNPDNAWNIVVWNLNSDNYNGYIEAEVQWLHEFPAYDKGIALEDEQGNRYECQIIREKSVIKGFRSRLLFKCSILPMGYKSFKVIKTEEDIKKRELDNISCIETKRYTIKLSQNGKISSVYDKINKKDICKNLLVPVCYVDDGDTWAFNIEHYGEECEPFDFEKIEITECGDFRTVIKVSYTFRSSKLDIYYTLYNDMDYIDVRYRVNWNEKHVVFKLVSDVNFNHHTSAIAYGSAERGETKPDIPVGEWIKTDSLTFCTDGVFAYNMVDNKLGLTVLRSPIYGDLRISEIDLDTDYDIMDQGICEGNIRVHFKTLEDPAGAACEFNNPPIVLCEANHDGTLDAEDSFLQTEAESVNIAVLKKAEEGDRIVLRGVEFGGISQEVRVIFRGKKYSFQVSAYEIFTVCIDNDDIYKTNMLEE